MKTSRITVVAIAQDEADRIGRLLESARFADAVIVVDSGSTDGTQALCRRMGATVIHHPWPGYAAQKQFAMERAASEWILNLDADEAVSPELAAEIRSAVNRAEASTAAFDMPRLSRYLGRWIRHGGWYPDRKLRLVRRGCGRWEGDALHERLTVTGSCGHLIHPILHYVYRDISDQLRTIDTYSGVYARNRPAAGGAFVVAGVFHALGKFIECFLWKRGFRDGIPGLVIAMNSAGYVFLKHAKSWERRLGA